MSGKKTTGYVNPKHVIGETGRGVDPLPEPEPAYRDGEGSNTDYDAPPAEKESARSRAAKKRSRYGGGQFRA